MTVSDMIRELEVLPPGASVFFDTEAQCYGCHLVPVERVYFHLESDTPSGVAIVTLHEDAPHRAGHAW